MCTFQTTVPPCCFAIPPSKPFRAPHVLASLLFAICVPLRRLARCEPPPPPCSALAVNVTSGQPLWYTEDDAHPSFTLVTASSVFISTIYLYPNPAKAILEAFDVATGQLRFEYIVPMLPGGAGFFDLPAVSPDGTLGFTTDNVQVSAVWGFAGQAQCVFQVCRSSHTTRSSEGISFRD